MNPYYVADQILQYSLNALIGFLIFAALTAIAFKLFKIHSPRLKASFRLVAPLRLILEPLFWLLPLNFALVNISFFSCSHPFQLYIYSYLSEETRTALNQYGLKSPMGTALLQISEPALWALITIFFLIIGIRVVLLLKGFVESLYKVRKIKSKSNEFDIANSQLNTFLKHHGITVLISDYTIIPFATWNKTIILPSILVHEYSANELDAVIAHEAEHIVRKDLVSRFAIRFVASIFWWVPMKGWNNLIEQEQEIASDAAIHTHALDKINLATALQKSAKVHFSGAWLAAFASKKHEVVNRIQMILSVDSSSSQSTFTTLAVILFLAALIPVITFIVC